MSVTAIRPTGLSLSGRTVSQLYASDQGRGEPVFCLHSSTGSHAQWREFGAMLQPRARVLAPDLLGHGRSPDWPARSGNILGADAGAVVAMASRAMAAAGSGGFHLVGHSYGAALALRIALRYPRLVRSLTLYEPVAFGCLRTLGAQDDAFEEIKAVASSVASLVYTGRHEEAARTFIGYWGGNASWNALGAAQQAGVVARIGTVPLQFAALFATGWTRVDLAQLAMPLLLLQGEFTREPARCVTELIADAVPHARVRTVPGAGHLGPLTHREPVLGWMQQHVLDQLAPQPVLRRRSTDALLQQAA